MLVLSRKVGERINIGDEIMVEVRRIAGNRVTLALKAPRSVRILRGELEQAAHEFDGDRKPVQATPAPPAAASPATAHEAPLASESPMAPLDTLSTNDSGSYFAMTQ